MGFDYAIRMEAADEASTATALRDKAEELESAGNHAQASVYYNAAGKAEQRADTWRSLLLTDCRGHRDPTVEFERHSEAGSDHDDVDAVIDDPELRQAYHMVLDASADEINRALNN